MEVDKCLCIREHELIRRLRNEANAEFQSEKGGSVIQRRFIIIYSMPILFAVFHRY